MEKTRQIAMLCVGRAVFFGGFAISLVMISFAFDFMLALRVGALLTLCMATILLWFAITSERRDPKKTEVWLVLPDNERPRNPHAARAFRQVMQDVHAHYARNVFLFSVTFFALSLAMQVAEVEWGIG
ncbi:MAG: hypothetical protein WAU86_17090 [Oricola sp.]